MNAAYQIIRDWPRSAHELFSTLADRNPQTNLEHPVRRIFATRMGFRLLGGLASIGGDPIRVLDDALENWLLQERGIYLDGRRRAKIRSDGEIAIDVADAMRRLEGRSINPIGIKYWEAAGAVETVRKKVLLSSVNRTVCALTQLIV